MTRHRSRLTPVAKRLRKADNTPEFFLWQALRNRNEGPKFRRQVPIGPYIADFACVELRLVIELDGSQHIDSPADRTRDRYLNDAGWSVARFPSGQMLSAQDDILETIAAICEGRVAEAIVDHDFQFYPAMESNSPPHPNPLPPSGEREQESRPTFEATSASDVRKSRNALPSPSPHLGGEGWGEGGYSTSDPLFMRRAISLATAQMGRTWPNPPVGCVLVKDGAIIAEVATGEGGRPHAEEIALDKAADKAKGAVAYVTLEPCGQRSGGGCSCGQRLAEAGVARVIYACDDPSPFASHKGPEYLKAAGIPYESGLLAEEAAPPIAGFVHWLQTGRPRVSESDGADMDALFEADPAGDLAAELMVWGNRGYRNLGVTPGSDLAIALRAAGLLSE